MRRMKLQKKARRWLSALSEMFGIYLCKLGCHDYARMPILTNLDLYWLQGGEECSRCRDKKISFAKAGRLAHYAYLRGKEGARNELLAYGAGLKDIVALYGKERVQRMLADMPDDQNQANGER